MNPLKLAYYCLDDGGCAYYRAILPFRTIEAKTGTKIFAVRKGANADDIAKTLNANVIQFARIAPYEELQGHMHMMKNRGIKLVLDYDDNVFDVSPYSPHYLDYGTEEFTDDFTGIKIWEDGVAGFNIAKNLERLENIREACRIVDMVTVTQPHLATVFREHNPNVVCLPNCVDARIWQKLPLKRADPNEIRLFWAGGCSHYIDLLHMIEPLKMVMARYPHVKLVMMGQQFGNTLAELPADRVEFHPWVHFEAYPSRVSILDPDINLVPLDDNKFNRCKSNIKWVEMSAMGIPSVVSAVSPYFEHYNGKNMVAVDNTTTAWADGLAELIESSILRAKIGGAAQSTVLNKFDMGEQYQLWMDAYQGLINA